MKNILHVINTSFAIPYFLGDQLLYFKKKGYNEYIICSPFEDLKKLSNKYEFEYKEVKITRKISIIKDLNAVFKTIRFIHKKKIDIVTGHTPKGALIAMLAAYIMHVPIRIYFRHGLVYETMNGNKRKLMIFLDRLTAYCATKIVCVSPSVCKKSLKDKLNPASKQYLLYKGTCNGIDVEKFCVSNTSNLLALKKKIGLSQSNFVIGFTGRLVRDKGIIELVSAFNELHKKYSNIVLLIVGMFEERDSLPDDIVNYIMHKTSIINIGYVSNFYIENYYALMDVFVLPSYREGFPTSILEASSMQLPIVTTKVTGCIDSIVEGKTGVFVDHDFKKIAAAIEMFYLNKKQRLEYGINGKNFVIDNFDQHIIWREIEKLYL